MSERDHITTAILQAGLVAVVHADFGVATVLEISDALLAVPLPVMAVALPNPHALDAITDLRARHGGNLVVGATHVTDAAQAHAALDAGAQFLLTEGDHAAIDRQAARRARLAIPLCREPRALAAFARVPVVACLLASGMVDEGAHALTPWQPTSRHGGQLLLACGPIGDDNIGACARAGFSAAVIGYDHAAATAWSARDLIVRARALRTAWTTAALERE